jgi:hypothetical protein
MAEDGSQHEPAHDGTLPRRDIRALVLDMDGVLLETEEVWHEVRRDYVALLR